MAATFTLRFYGRFVFAEPYRGDASLGMVHVLPTNPQFNQEVGAEKHQFVVAAPRTRVVPLGTRRADMIMMAAMPPTQSEHAIWDLTDCELVIGSANTFQWAGAKDRHQSPFVKDAATDEMVSVANLRELTNNAGSFSDSLLNATGTAGVTTATIRLHEGTATPRQMAPENFEFVPVKDPNAVAPAIGVRRLADFVDVDFNMPPEKPLLVMQIRSRSGGPVTAIAVNALPALTTIVTFTNLCSRPYEPIDQEFAAHYEVLENPPLTRDRLIPRAVAPRLGGDFDCTKAAYISYPQR
jgi:hypothetical protein